MSDGVQVPHIGLSVSTMVYGIIMPTEDHQIKPFALGHMAHEEQSEPRFI